MTLVPDLTWPSWIRLRSKLTKFCVIKETAALVNLHNSEVIEVVCF